MVFRAERYPSDWKEIRARILTRAGNACECAGECGDEHPGDNGRCDAPNGVEIWREAEAPARWVLAGQVGRYFPFEAFVDNSPVKVVLTIAHLNHDESDNRDGNLAALCQRCHLKLDAQDNAKRRRENREVSSGQAVLPGMEARRG